MTDASEAAAGPASTATPTSLPASAGESRPEPSAVRGAAGLLVSRFLVLCIAVAFATVVPRALGAKEFGYYQSWFAAVTALMVILSAVTDAVTRRYFPELLVASPGSLAPLFGRMALFKAALAAVLALAVFALREAHLAFPEAARIAALLLGKFPLDDAGALGVALAAAVGVSFSNYFASVAYAFRRMGWYGAHQVLVNGSRLALVLILFSWRGREGVLPSLLLAPLPALVVIGLLATSLLPPGDVAGRGRGRLGPYLGFGVLVYGGYALITLVNRLPVAMLGQGEAELATVGWVGLGVQVATMIYVLGGAAVEVMMPDLVTHQTRGDAPRARETLHEAWRAALGLTVPLAVGALVLSAALVELVLGEQYRGATPYLGALIPLGAAQVAIDYFQKVVIVRDRHRAFFLLQVANFIVFLAAAAFLVNSHGPAGAVTSIWIGHLPLAAGLVWMERRELARPGFWRALLLPAFSAALMALAMVAVEALAGLAAPGGGLVWLVVWRLVAPFLAGAAVYVVAMRLTGGFTRADGARILAAFGRPRPGRFG
ncbi:MAG: oligosaccharide flippase family protein [Planctomycetes bacterium]|nr:oligosaccharide flippase family protein [Planctomycetota bacterium]